GPTLISSWSRPPAYRRRHRGPRGQAALDGLQRFELLVELVDLALALARLLALPLDLFLESPLLGVARREQACHRLPWRDVGRRGAQKPIEQPESADDVAIAA